MHARAGTHGVCDYPGKKKFQAPTTVSVGALLYAESHRPWFNKAVAKINNDTSVLPTTTLVTYMAAPSLKVGPNEIAFDQFFVKQVMVGFSTQIYAASIYANTAVEAQRLMVNIGDAMLPQARQPLVFVTRGASDLAVRATFGVVRRFGWNRIVIYHNSGGDPAESAKILMGYLEGASIEVALVLPRGDGAAAEPGGADEEALVHARTNIFVFFGGQGCMSTMVMSLTKRMRELAIICCCSIELFAASVVPDFPDGLMNVYEGMYTLPSEQGKDPHMAPASHIWPELVEQAVRAFALALDKVIKTGGDPMDVYTVASTMRSSSFNVSLSDLTIEQEYKFNEQGTLIQKIGLANLVDQQWKKIGVWEYETKEMVLESNSIVWPKGTTKPRDCLDCKSGEYRRLIHGREVCDQCSVGMFSDPEALPTVPLQGIDSTGSCLCEAAPRPGVDTLQKDGREFILRKNNLTANDVNSSYLLPKAYGSFCRVWDASDSNSCIYTATHKPREDAPEWCKLGWCYVNATACADFEPTRSWGFPHADLYFSYDICDARKLAVVEQASRAKTAITECTRCPAGFFANSKGTRKCASCKDLGDYYQRNVGTDSCMHCPENSYRPPGSEATSIADCVCAEGFFVDRCAIHWPVHYSRRAPGLFMGPCTIHGLFMGPWAIPFVAQAHCARGPFPSWAVPFVPLFRPMNSPWPMNSLIARESKRIAHKPMGPCNEENSPWAWACGHHQRMDQ